LFDSREGSLHIERSVPSIEGLIGFRTWHRTSRL